MKRQYMHIRTLRLVNKEPDPTTSGCKDDINRARLDKIGPRIPCSSYQICGKLNAADMSKTDTKLDIRLSFSIENADYSEIDSVQWAAAQSLPHSTDLGLLDV